MPNAARSRPGKRQPPRRHAASLEQIVLRRRQRRWLGHIRAPGLEDVQVPMQQENLVDHLPAAGKAAPQSALVLFDQMAEVVNDRLALAKPGARAEEVERRLD